MLRTTRRFPASSRTMKPIRATFVVLAALAATVAFVLPTAAQSAPVASAAATCPGTFQVLHDDRIGTLKLPAGPYTITTSGKVTCNQASALFTRFLEDWDGILPGGWKVKGSGFASSTAAFTVKASVTPPNPPPPNGQTCPGTFTLHDNDKINGLSLKAGNYVIQLTKKGASLTCDQAGVQFSTFLTKNYTKPLPAPWTLDVATSTFSEGGGIGFKVIRTGGGTGGGGNTTGILCPATFRVVHNDQIGSLKVKAGSYYIYVIGNLTCQQVTADFKLDLNLGRVPNSQWKLDTQTATFLFNKTRGFRVEPVNGV
jgi:hypothetical protein